MSVSTNTQTRYLDSGIHPAGPSRTHRFVPLALHVSLDLSMYDTLTPSLSIYIYMFILYICVRYVFHSEGFQGFSGEALKTP